MVNSAQRIYWDACAWIGYLNKEEDKFAVLEQIWNNALQGTYEIWTSTYSFIEVIYRKNEIGQPYPPAENDAIAYHLLESAP